MKIVFTSKGKDWSSEIDPRFGRADYFIIFDEASNNLEIVDNTEVQGEAHGAGTKAASKIAEIKPDVLITGNGPGGNAETALRALNINIYVGAANMTIKDAYEAFKNQKLTKF
jgi:predicted Fe-Mo cluster-binding NifX family protein